MVVIFYLSSLELARSFFFLDIVIIIIRTFTLIVFMSPQLIMNPTFLLCYNCVCRFGKALCDVIINRTTVPPIKSWGFAGSLYHLTLRTSNTTFITQ